jgi:hypothetical protein
MEDLPIDITLNIAFKVDIGTMLSIVKEGMMRALFGISSKEDLFWKYYFKKSKHKNLLLFIEPTYSTFISIKSWSDTHIESVCGQNSEFRFINRPDLVCIHRKPNDKHFVMIEGCKKLEDGMWLIKSKKRKGNIYSYLGVKAKKYENIMVNDNIYVDKDFVIKLGKHPSIKQMLNPEATIKLLNVINRKVNIDAETIIDELGYTKIVELCRSYEKTSELVEA